MQYPMSHNENIIFSQKNAVLGAKKENFCVKSRVITHLMEKHGIRNNGICKEMRSNLFIWIGEKYMVN